jgi:hypothetical protein
LCGVAKAMVASLGLQSAAPARNAFPAAHQQKNILASSACGSKSFPRERSEQSCSLCSSI